MRAVAFCLIALLVGCASFGLPASKTTGQGVVQTYGNALAVSSMIPGLLTPPATITTDQARKAQDASKTIRTTIDSYWDVAGLAQCKQAPEAVCEGPNAVQVLTILNASIIQIEKFLLDHQGAKK